MLFIFSFLSVFKYESSQVLHTHTYILPPIILLSKVQVLFTDFLTLARVGTCLFEDKRLQDIYQSAPNHFQNRYTVDQTRTRRKAGAIDHAGIQYHPVQTQC